MFIMVEYPRGNDRAFRVDPSPVVNDSTLCRGTDAYLDEIILHTADKAGSHKTIERFCVINKPKNICERSHIVH
jgi:hypothetical protein